MQQLSSLTNILLTTRANVTCLSNSGFVRPALSGNKWTLSNLSSCKILCENMRIVRECLLLLKEVDSRQTFLYSLVAPTLDNNITNFSVAHSEILHRTIKNKHCYHCCCWTSQSHCISNKAEQNSAEFWIPRFPGRYVWLGTLVGIL